MTQSHHAKNISSTLLLDTSPEFMLNAFKQTRVGLHFLFHKTIQKIVH